MKINSTVVESTELYVMNYLSVHLDEKFSFHNLSHTESVVNAVKKICTGIDLKKHETKILLVAAWFHDLGYTERIEEHEDIGALHAENFLKELNVDEADIEQVKNCIIATHYPQHPLTNTEMILCDADLLHLADKHFFESADLLRKEWTNTKDKRYNDEEWLELNIKFLSDHSYHTQYCKDNFEDKKKRNIQKLIAMRQYEDDDYIDLTKDATVSDIKKSKKEKQPDYSKGVDTLFRIASGNHMHLSGMADNKAHILLSINSIIISFLLSVLAKKLTEQSFLILPTMLLLCVCLVSIVFAVLTTRPKISKNNFDIEQMNNKQVNLLFFGNFHHMNAETYEHGIGEVMRDKEYLYKTLTKDVYYLGKVLAVKYRYLNIGYTIFMCGLIASVITFGISFFLNHPL